MKQLFKKIILGLCISIFIFPLCFGNVLALEDKLNTEEVESTVNTSKLDEALYYVSQLKASDMSVFTEESLENVLLLSDEISENYDEIIKNQDFTDDYSDELLNLMHSLKVKEDYLKQISDKISEGEDMLSQGSSNFDEDDFILLQNMVSEASNFLDDYYSNGIDVFLPNNKTIGQVSEEVHGEVDRLTVKIQNAIDRLNLKRLTLPDLSEYEGESIAQGLYSVGEDGSYSARDILFAKAGFSEQYWGNFRQNVTLLSYLKGNGANILNLQLYIAYASQIIETGSYDNLDELQKSLDLAIKFLDKYNKLGVKVLPTKQDKVDDLTFDIMEAIDGINPYIILKVDDDYGSYISESSEEIAPKIESLEDKLSVLLDGDNVFLFVSTLDYEENIPDEDKIAIMNFLSDGEKLGRFLDINLYRQIGDEVTKIEKTNGKIKISMVLPEELKNTDGGVLRNFYIIKVHDGVVSRISVTLEGDIMTFETDEFSSYAISYIDSPKSVNSTLNPKTSDSVINYVLIFIFSLIPMTVLVKKIDM